MFLLPLVLGSGFKLPGHLIVAGTGSGAIVHTHVLVRPSSSTFIHNVDDEGCGSPATAHAARYVVVVTAGIPGRRGATESLSRWRRRALYATCCSLRARFLSWQEAAPARADRLRRFVRTGFGSRPARLRTRGPMTRWSSRSTPSTPSKRVRSADISVAFERTGKTFGYEGSATPSREKLAPCARTSSKPSRSRNLKNRRPNARRAHVAISPPL